jgi:NTE family protein
MQNSVKGIVLNGGGVLGVGHIGALERLGEEDIKGFKVMAGASVGALIAAALALGASQRYLDKMIKGMDFKKFLDDTSYDFDIVDTYRLINHYGWYKGEALDNFYKQVIHDLCGDANITMQEAFVKTRNYLCMTAFRANDCRTEDINHVTWPHLPLHLALRIASSYPFFFVAEIISTHDVARYTAGRFNPGCDVMFADGGILNNYPMQLLAANAGLELGEIIGLHLTGVADFNRTGVAPIPFPQPPKNIIAFTLGMGSSIMEQSRRIHVPDDCWARTIKIDCKELTSTNFSMTHEETSQVFQAGRDAASLFLGL